MTLLPDGAIRFGMLAERLAVLASPVRLEILHFLRSPSRIGDIRVRAAAPSPGANPYRFISRPAVKEHLTALAGVHLVRNSPGRNEREKHYVIDHERLFALVDEMRQIAKLRPLLGDASPPGRTLVGQLEAQVRVDRPRLVVAYGRDDGRAFSLSGGPGSAWGIGRAPECDIHLDYDPYVSAVHCSVTRDERGFLVRDGGSRNGTLVNWERLKSGEERRLSPGDFLGVGRSVLGFQP